MSERLYLVRMAEELRDTVAPLVTTDKARDILLACQRTLLRLAYPMGDTGPGAELPLPMGRLPADLRAALPEPSLPAPDLYPPDNMAMRPDRIETLRAVTNWIAAAPASPEAATAIRALADWEGALQDAAEDYSARFENTSKGAEIDLSIRIDPQAMEAYLKSRSTTPDRVRMTAFRQLPGGRSKQTALVSQTGLDDLPAEIVIRRDNTSPIISRSAALELPLLKIVEAAGVAVPRPLFAEFSRDWIGAPFVAMARVAGKAQPSFFGVPVGQADLALQLAEQVARIHAIPIERFRGVLDDIPSVDSPDRRRAQLAATRELWIRWERMSSVTMTTAFRWLEDNLHCLNGVTTLVHSDVGFHNIMVENGRLTALLDWEGAIIGSPAQDLGYCRQVVEKMIPWNRFMDRYFAAGGQKVTAQQVNVFSLWETMRIDSYMIYARHLFESGRTDDMLLGEIGSYYIPRFVHRVSEQLRRILREES